MSRFNARELGTGKSTIICNNGSCSIESNVDIMGIEIDFIGIVSITPTLPDGWIMQGNKSKMLLFGLQGLVIKNQKLFTYEGTIKLKKVVVGNKEGKQIICNIQNVKPTWLHQNWRFDIDTSSWEDYKDTKRVGKVKKTIYNLPDYDLPKVEKKTKIKRTKASSRSTGGY